MKLFKRYLVLLAIIASSTYGLFGKADPQAEPYRSEAAKLMTRSLPRTHLSRKPCDDEIAESALKNYLGILDYDRSYFLASDIREFEKMTDKLDDQILEGNVEFAFRVFEVLKERVSNRVEYVETLLAEGFDLDVDETYEWKREKAEWPADEEEWDELWRKRIKNQYVGRIVADTLAKEEREKNPEQQKDEPKRPEVTPEEFVRKNYKQYMTMLNHYDSDWVIERYLTAFAKAYDPHSNYMSPSNTEDFNISMRLSLVGIGALLSSEDGAAKIEQIISGGPAERDGRLKAGDKIIAVGQGNEEPVDILHWPLNKVIRLIRGEKDTKVVLTVIPASDLSGTSTTTIDLIRDEVKLEDQAARGEVREIVDEDGSMRRLGIITLPEFYADMQSKPKRGDPLPRSSANDVRNLLNELVDQKVDGIVLNLRDNGGGLLTEAIEMTGLFIGKGPVVQVYGVNGSRVLDDLNPNVVYDGPLVVLVNRQTASASEILAGALQDYGRAVIVGDSKTHGKGTVQTLSTLQKGDPSLGTLKVTSASFYRIAGGSTQMKGIIPDIVTPSYLDLLEIGEEYLPHALKWSKIAKAPYKAFTNLISCLPILKERSELRRQRDERFAHCNEIMEKLIELKQSKEVSLRLEDRLLSARNEKEVQKWLQSSSDSRKRKDEASKDEDLVMNEALNILCDLIALEEDPEGITLQSKSTTIAGAEASRDAETIPGQ